MSAAAIPAIEVHNLTVAYHQRPVLWSIDLQVATGSMCAVIGPNGAGKSTLLKAILDLVPIVHGAVRIFGLSLAETRRRVAYMPQRESVDWDFPITVAQVVMMGRYGKLRWLRRPSRSDRLLLDECLQQVGLEDFGSRQIGQLSGGQQQRVFLARALMQEAELYIMDEPFSGVDAATEVTILKILQALQRTGRTIVAVHHDLQTVPRYFSHVVMLNQRLVVCGEMSAAFKPENLERTYGGRLTLLDRLAEAMRGEAPPSTSFPTPNT